jgi:calcineurin-like phosphoesterase family protein
MLWGNHNNPVESVYRREVFAKYGEEIKVYPFRYRNVIFLGDYQELLLDGQILIMMHYPVNVWNFMKESAFMLCGHSHYSFPVTRADFKEGLILDVGWDGNLGPYSFDDIKSIMSKKKIKEVDHHVNEKS